MSSHPETVLVTEHDQALRQLLCRALRPEGYRVVQAGSAEEAVRTAAQHTTEIDLLLTEARLPHLQGWELADLLRLDYPNLKVVYMSDGVDAALRARARQSKVVVLQNPFCSDPIREAVHEALDSDGKDTASRSLLQRLWDWCPGARLC